MQEYALVDTDACWDIHSFYGYAGDTILSIACRD
jgi:hypothetical protein